MKEFKNEQQNNKLILRNKIINKYITETVKCYPIDLNIKLLFF